jgi:hypothetical protein
VILLYIFIMGCFVTGIVAVGLVFAFAAAGFGGGNTQDAAPPQDKAVEPPETPNQKVYKL